MFQPTLTPTRSPSPSSPSSVGSIDSPVSLNEEKRSFSWPGSLPYYHLSAPTSTRPSFVPPFTSIPLTSNIQPSKQTSDLVPLRTTTNTTPSPVTPLWANTSVPSAAVTSIANQQSLMTATSGTSPVGIQHLPIGTQFLYQVASTQGLGLQSPLIAPLLTVLPTGVVGHQSAAAATTVSPRHVLLNPTQGLSVLAQGQVPSLIQQQTASPAPAALPKLFSMVSSTTSVAKPSIPEPSTGQTVTSPMTEFPSGSQSPPRTLASIPPAEMTRAYAELKAFAEEFKTKRIRLGYTQGAVGQSLADKGYSNFAQSTISRFEQMQLSPTNAAAIKQVLEKWLQEAESPTSASSTSNIGPAMASRKRKKRAVFTPQTRTSMEEFFRQNPRPNRQTIDSIAQQLDLLPEEVRVWFCNKRQKQKQQHGMQMGYYDRDASSVSSGTASPTSFYDHTLFRKRSPSPKTSFTIEELSKSSTNSVTSSPIQMSSPFAVSPMGAVTTLSGQNVFPMLLTPGSSNLRSISPFLSNASVVAQTKA